jgi:hypothetical protein
MENSSLLVSTYGAGGPSSSGLAMISCCKSNSKRNTGLT